MEKRAVFIGICFLLVYLSGNLYVIVKLLKGMGKVLQALDGILPFGKSGIRVCKVVFAVFLCVAAVSMFVALFARDSNLLQWLHAGFYNVGSIWLVFLMYMVLALIVVDLVKVFWGGAFLNRFGTFIALSFVLALLVGGYINYRNPRVEEIAIDLRNGDNCSKPADHTLVGEQLQEQVHKIKIVAVSDVHLGHATGKKHLQKYVEKINSLNPDIILIGGDLIDNNVVPLQQQRMDEELSLLKARLGIYMVPGNHEYIASRNLVKVEEFLSNTPIVLLRDSVVVLSDGLALVGVDDRHHHTRSVHEDLKGKVGGRHSILLEHQPSNLTMKDSVGFDVIFSGHTHRGQVWPFTYVVESMYEQSHGYRKWSNSHVIVSSGLSLWGPPFRIGTNSDMWVIDLQY